MRPVIKTFLTLVLSVTLVHSCTFPDPVLTSTTDHHNWNAQNPAVFRFVTSAKPHDIKIIVRHTDQYAFQTLPLIVTTTFTDRTYFCDTISIPLCNAQGQWNGQKLGNTLNVTVPYRSGVVFSHNPTPEDTVTITLAPALPPVAYIHLVGIQITNAKPLFKP